MHFYPAVFSFSAAAEKTEILAARFACLLGAMFVYALFGSPTPDYPGWPEASVALLLALAVGLPAVANGFVPVMHEASWCRAAKILLIFGFTFPLISGVIHGNDPQLILRDLVAFLFFLFPLLTIEIFERRPHYFKYFVAMFAASGFLFSFRGLEEVHIIDFSWPPPTAELRYLANAPTVLFAAIFPICFFAHRFLKDLKFLNLAMLAVITLLTFLPMLAMAVTLQRASLGYMLLSWVITAAVLFWFYPRQALGLLIFAAACAIPFYGYFSEHLGQLLGLLEHKTEIYGINKREMEAAAVWDAVRQNFFTMFFGLGWGGTFESPAVGGVRVNYTHCSLTGMLLKTGLMGLCLSLTYITMLCRPMIKILNRNLILGLALAGPFVIDVLLYASYKWLDFGLLLLLIVAAARPQNPSGVASPRGLLYAGT